MGKDMGYEKLQTGRPVPVFYQSSNPTVKWPYQLGKEVIGIAITLNDKTKQVYYYYFYLIYTIQMTTGAQKNKMKKWTKSDARCCMCPKYQIIQPTMNATSNIHFY